MFVLLSNEISFSLKFCAIGSITAPLPLAGKGADATIAAIDHEQPVYNIPFKEDFGKVVGLIYNFAGTGAVKEVRLKNGAGKVVYEDAFEQQY